MKYSILLLFALLSHTWALKDSISITLHINTWPNHAEVSFDKKPSHRNTKPVYSSISTDTFKENIGVYIRKVGYQDTNFIVKTDKNSAQNYVFIKLNEEFDENAIALQHKFDNKRKRAKIGAWTIKASIIPTIIGTGYLIENLRSQSQRDHYLHRSQNAVLIDTPTWKKDYNNYSKYNKSVKEHRKKAISYAVASASLCAIGLILKF